MTASGAPPTVDTKSLFVQSVGSRDFNVRNSCRNVCDETPLRFLTHLWMPNCRSTSTSPCTCSGMISQEMISPRYFFSGLSHHPFTAFCNRTNQHTAPILGRPHAMIFAGIHHIMVRFGTLLVPCLNRHLSNTSEIGFASQNTPYIPSPKGRGLYGAFSVRIGRETF